MTVRAVDLEFAVFDVAFEFFHLTQQLGPLLFFNDEADATLCTAAAWMIIPGIHIEAVVVGQFFTGLDFTD